MRFINRDQLLRNPSIADGVPVELFENARSQCVSLVFGVSERLDLPLCVAARASMLFQEFYQRRSLLKNDCFLVAIACLYVGTKVRKDTDCQLAY